MSPAARRDARQTVKWCARDRTDPPRGRLPQFRRGPAACEASFRTLRHSITTDLRAQGYQGAAELFQACSSGSPTSTHVLAPAGRSAGGAFRRRKETGGGPPPISSDAWKAPRRQTNTVQLLPQARRCTGITLIELGARRRRPAPHLSAAWRVAHALRRFAATVSNARWFASPPVRSGELLRQRGTAATCDRRPVSPAFGAPPLEARPFGVRVEAYEVTAGRDAVMSD